MRESIPGCSGGHSIATNKCAPTVVLRSKSDDLFVRTGFYLTALLQDDKNLIGCLPQSSSVAIDAEEASAVFSFETATRGCRVAVTRIFIIVAALVVSAMVFEDLASAIQSGRARGPDGTIARKDQPERFRRHIHSDYIFLGLCAVAILWSLIHLIRRMAY